MGEEHLCHKESVNSPKFSQVMVATPMVEFKSRGGGFGTAVMVWSGFVDFPTSGSCFDHKLKPSGFKHTTSRQKPHLLSKAMF